MINLQLDFLNPPSLILNKSNTDLLDLSGEFFVPTVDFTVIKHYLFFNLYYLFIFVNFDLIIRKKLISKILSITAKLCFVLFAIIWIEFALGIVFKENFLRLLSLFFRLDFNSIRIGPYGFYVVEGRLNEPSTILITFPYFFVCAENQKNNFLKSILMFCFGFAGVLMTGSTTGLIVVALCGIYFLVKTFTFNKNYFVILIIFIILFLILFISIFQEQFLKLLQFLNFNSKNNDWGSGTFRSNSIIYAIRSFLEAPLFGVGIGTVYCHGMFFQVLSNLGIAGLVLFYISYQSTFRNFRFSPLKIFICFIIFLAGSLIQCFTSPYFLLVIYSCVKQVEGVRFFKKKLNGELVEVTKPILVVSI